MEHGQIIRAVSGNFYVLSNDQTFKCRASAKFRYEKKVPVVGDFVSFTIENNDEGYIREIHERKNSLIRPLMANIDQAIIICSAKEPDFSHNLLDRFLALIEFNHIKPVICFTKMDLADDQTYQYINDYQQAGYEVYTTNKNESNQHIISIFKDKVSVFVGQSGAGKSSLLNSLDNELNLETNGISKALGRGKHTTRHTNLFSLFGGLIADTPGFSSLEFSGMTPIDIAHCYHDFEYYSSNCQFRDCVHDKEQKCGVKQAVEQGLIKHYRYEDYLIFLEEIRNRKVKY